jgi:dTDP-glucose pyrophosphorylase
MRVVIPMMGIGRRFTDAGYLEKKPFIRICGKTVIERVVDPLLKRFDTVYVTCTSADAAIIEKIFISTQVIPIVLDESRGASQTIYETCKFLEKHGYGEDVLLSIDCDTILSDEGISKIEEERKNIIYTFEEPNRNGMYCYVNTVNSTVISIQEKNAISKTAGAGVYQFSTVEVARDFCKKILMIKDRELYLSDVYNEMIKTGTSVEIADISEKFECVGTPYQLRQFSSKINLTDKIFCFDVDRTLVYDIIDSEKMKMIEKNVIFLRHVFQNGAKVILHTARGMLSRNGDLITIENELKPIIEHNLKTLEIPYHELILGKPYADFYIDDKGYNSFFDMYTSTGIYLPLDTQPRNHHKIKVADGVVTKIGNLEAEHIYYSSLPDSLLYIFPKILTSSSDKIEMQYVNSHTYSSLLINGRMTETHLERLMDIMNQFHTYPVSNFDLDIEWAYKHKMRERFRNDLDLYQKIDLESYFDRLNKIAETINSGTIGVIHGDPVFTNIFESGTLIDPRGKWENEFTVYGDIEYDYAKILQSLNGYDYALNDLSINENYLNRLKWKFFDICRSQGISVDRIVRKSIIITASMIPFHKENLSRCKRFSKIVKTLVDEYKNTNEHGKSMVL